MNNKIEHNIEDILTHVSKSVILADIVIIGKNSTNMLVTNAHGHLERSIVYTAMMLRVYLKDMYTSSKKGDTFSFNGSTAYSSRITKIGECKTKAIRVLFMHNKKLDTTE